MQKKMKAFDVVVVGGGMAGVISALAAAEQGASVMLIEKGSCLGGVATEGMLGEINGAYLNGVVAIPEIGRRILDRLIKQGFGVFRQSVPMTSNPDIKVDRLRYHSEYLKLVLDEMVVENNIKVLFCATLKQVLQMPKGVLLTIGNNFEEISIYCNILVDSTGNSECIYLAGGETISSHKMDKQAVSIIFRLGGIDVDRFEELGIDEIQEIIKFGKKKGVLPGDILSETFA